MEECRGLTVELTSPFWCSVRDKSETQGIAAKSPRSISTATRMSISTRVRKVSSPCSGVHPRTYAVLSLGTIRLRSSSNRLRSTSQNSDRCDSTDTGRRCAAHRGGGGALVPPTRAGLRRAFEHDPHDFRPLPYSYRMARGRGGRRRRSLPVAAAAPCPVGTPVLALRRICASGGASSSRSHALDYRPSSRNLWRSSGPEL
jgi:hypothetical protein